MTTTLTGPFYGDGPADLWPATRVPHPSFCGGECSDDPRGRHVLHRSPDVTVGADEDVAGSVTVGVLRLDEVIEHGAEIPSPTVHVTSYGIAAPTDTAGRWPRRRQMTIGRTPLNFSAAGARALAAALLAAAEAAEEADEQTRHLAAEVMPPSSRASLAGAEAL